MSSVASHLTFARARERRAPIAKAVGDYVPIATVQERKNKLNMSGWTVAPISGNGERGGERDISALDPIDLRRVNRSESRHAARGLNLRITLMTRRSRQQASRNLRTLDPVVAKPCCAARGLEPPSTKVAMTGRFNQTALA